MPENYWAHFLLGRTLLASSQFEAGLDALAKAMARPDPSRIGAKFIYCMEKAKSGIIDFEDIVSSAINEAEATDQKRWYFSNLCMLRAISQVALGKPLAFAERDLRAGYQFLSSVDERPFRLPWATEALAPLDLSGFPYLAHLRNALTIASGPDYHAELKRLGGNTIVLEIGANDGVKTDPVREFIVKNNWSAILVEPVASSYNRLLENYADHERAKCCKVAITARSGPIVMNLIDPSKMGIDGLDPQWAEGVSSISTSGSLHFYRNHLIQEEVEGITFAEFAEREGITRFDVLQIDTEGHDFIVFDQIDLDRYGVKVVQIEINNLQPPDRLAIIETLKAQGFRISYDSIDLTASRI